MPKAEHVSTTCVESCTKIETLLLDLRALGAAVANIGLALVKEEDGCRDPGEALLVLGDRITELARSGRAPVEAILKARHTED